MESKEPTFAPGQKFCPTEIAEWAGSFEEKRQRRVRSHF